MSALFNSNLSDNILWEINEVLLSIPQDVDALHKVRYVYKKLGELFSYDYRIVYDNEIASKKIDFEADYINEYQTCLQISSILNIIINNAIPGCKSEIFIRKLTNRPTTAEHYAVRLYIDDYKYILDLTTDLFYIQTGCQTKSFGFATTPYGNEDIISLNECRQMDEKLGLIPFGGYTDGYIEQAREELDMIDNSELTKEQQIDLRIKKISSFLSFKKAKGFNEIKMFANLLMVKLLPFNIKDYNLYYNDENSFEMISLIQIEDDYWYIFSPKLHIIKTDLKHIKELLSCGWNCNSQTLKELVNQKEEKRINQL